MNDTILEVNHIRKTFIPPLSYRDILTLNLRKRPPVAALVDVSFLVKKGQVVGILGPNGAGKTTLLKIIATLILPDDGTLIVGDNNRIDKDDEKIKKLIGLLFSQERSFYSRLSGRQNLEFFSALYGLNAKEAKRRCGELFGLFEVSYADKRFNTYSAGMKQKFALMRALLHDPEILLLDEPTKSLDFGAACALRTFIKKELSEKQGKTILLATHQMDEASEFCNFFLVLDKGSILASGSLEDLRRLAGAPQAALGDIFLKICSQNR